MSAPQFPIGEFVQPAEFTDVLKQQYVQRLRAAPATARQTVAGLDDGQLDTRYRNWSIRQIIHHLADSHINCYVRFKWALTEPTPHIKSYDETLWSEVVDARTAPLESSLGLLAGLHDRWADLVERLSDDQLDRGYFHPEIGEVVKLSEALPYYVWHVDHHLGQIDWLRNQHGWQ